MHLSLFACLGPLRAAMPAPLLPAPLLYRCWRVLYDVLLVDAKALHSSVSRAGRGRSTRGQNKATGAALEELAGLVDANNVDDLQEQVLLCEFILHFPRMFGL